MEHDKPGPRAIDMLGYTLGSQIVVGYAGLTPDGLARWRVLCRDCGNETIFTGSALRKRRAPGGVKPCPCLTPKQRRERAARIMRLAGYLARTTRDLAR